MVLGNSSGQINHGVGKGYDIQKVDPCKYFEGFSTFYKNQNKISTMFIDEIKEINTIIQDNKKDSFHFNENIKYKKTNTIVADDSVIKGHYSSQY
jgi:hypothetical protein